MLIENETGVHVSNSIEWPGGPGIWSSTSVLDNQVVALERLGEDGTTWVPIGELAVITGNGVVAFELDKCTLRADQASGTAVFADVTTRRVSL